jgi:hypothetical protein
VNRLSVCVLLTALCCGHSSAGSLWGLYEFNNPGNPGLDSTSNHNDLSVFGSAIYTSSGHYGGGLSLATGDLSTSDGSAPSGFPLGNSNYTLSAWIQTSANGSLGIIGWGAYGSTGQVNALRLDGTGGIDNYWWGGGYDLLVAAATDDDTFHNVTVTFDGTTRIIYLDDVAVAQDTPPAGHNVASQDFAIGKTFSGEYFTGTLDNVAVFDEALTAGQVGAIASGDFSAFGVSGPSAVPEPSPVVLTAAGAALLLWRRRRIVRG